jgi:periplasmic glucans biosynthesis protein
VTIRITSLVVAMAALVSYPAQAAEEKPESTLTALKTAAAKALGVKLANDDLPEEPPKEPGEPPSFYDTVVVQEAKKLSLQNFERPVKDASKALTQVDYSQYRAIRFNTEKSLWRDQSPFEVQFFHPGFLYQDPLTIKTVENDLAATVNFDRSLFRYDGPAAPLAETPLPSDNFAGFRVHYSLNSSKYKDEFMVFQGASYFRLVGPGQAYGLSARGLAIDTAEPTGEEFPYFREFWLKKPGPNENTLTIYALLDSPSLAGAYKFEVKPGRRVEVEVEGTLFARKDVKKLGIAPLTSMFVFGENSVVHHDDYRKEVHDSDGLQILSGSGEWIWRPLQNPVNLHVSAMQDKSPKGFGLMQRDREFDHYLDVEAHYHQRPSFWVEPIGKWGKGAVELVEIPTDSETNDNIVAYWISAKPLLAKQKKHFRYRVKVLNETPPNATLGRVLYTTTGWAALPGQANPPPKSKRLFVVDFYSGDLEGVSGDMPVVPNLTTSSGKVSDLMLQKIPGLERWRAYFKLEPEANKPVDMRLNLTLNGKPITETWTYVWYPESLPKSK